jgi:hypothetical protein
VTGEHSAGDRMIGGLLNLSRVQRALHRTGDSLLAKRDNRLQQLRSLSLTPAMLIRKKLRLFKKIEHAKSVILNGQQLVSKEYAKCGTNFYATGKQTRCGECIANGLRRAS